MRPLFSYFDQGQAAFLDGRDISSNISPPGSLASIDWERGYLDAQMSKTVPAQTGQPATLIQRDTILRMERRKLIEAVQAGLPDIVEVAGRMGMELTSWPMNCYAVAHTMLESGLLDATQQSVGRLVIGYGQYFGPVSRASVFAQGMRRHAWLETNDGLIIDPTRYVFEAGEPSFWVGSLEDYDFSGARLREAMSPDPPPFADDNLIDVSGHPDELIAALAALLQDQPRLQDERQLSRLQLHWVATRSLERLGTCAPLLLDLLEDSKAEGLMPVDQRRFIRRFAEKASFDQRLGLPGWPAS